MPRSFDRTPAPFNDPNQGIEFHIGTAFQQGLDMWKAIIDALGEFAENLVKELIQKLLGLDVDPEQALEDLWNLLTGWTDDIPILGDIIQIVKDFLNGNSFPGVLSISRIANIIQDLIYGAGEFLTAESVTDNPYFDWDSVTPGFISGGSIRATANGTQQVLRTEPFEVFPGQTLELRAASQWTGASATAGSNPVKVGFTPFDADGNPLTDVIRGSLQPSGDHGWQWIPVADKWPVPAGVKYVSQLLILDAGATAGTFRFSNASAWASNLLDLGLVKDLREMVDAIGGVVNSEAANIEARLQAITADGKITASEIQGLIQQAQVSGLVIIQTVLNQIRDVINGLVVTPVNSIVQDFKDWFGLNQNKTQKLTTGGSLDGNAITGTISDLVSGVAAVRDALTAGMGAVGSTFTNNDAKNQAIYLQQMSAQAAAATSAIQAQIQRNQATAPAGLASYITTFGGSDGAALPAEFTGSDLKIRTANGYCGIDASKPDGTYYVTCNKQTTTDDVQTTVVIGDAGGLNSIATYTLFSSDSTNSTGAYLGVNGNSVQVGKYTRSGAVFTFSSPFMSWSGQLGQGIAVTAYRKANNWVLDVGGDVKATATDATVTTGASNRYGGAIVMMRKTSSGGWFSGSYQYDSLRLASVFLGDFYAKATNYSGARLQRAVGAANTAGPTHPYSLPGNGSVTVTGAWGGGAFGVIGFSSDDMVANTANGTIVVNTSGLYYVEHRDPAWTWSAGTAIEPSASALDVVINTVNHITLEGDYELLDGTANTDTGRWSVTGHTGVPVPAFLRLGAGDVIQLGYTVTLKNTGSSSRSGNAVFTLTGTAPGLLGIYKMG
ncbi:autotransporter outer membrane beta-barrel domain-containing protein [Mycobacteroides abscessus]|uniref:hypothetical protein n=1 Tax=Mycobacteroides abscessus TaxID=36809 RepID=UPI001890A54D|nr:hypothetical protein [Mycobacteroides abscessus]